MPEQTPQAVPDKVIDIPNVGPIAFPGTMSDDDINTAASKLYQDANKTHPPPAKEHSWVSTALDWLPAAGGAIGGLIGGVGGTVGGVGVGGVPGAIGGAAVGGAGGEALKQLGHRLLGESAPATPMQAAKDIALSGGVQGASEAIGAGVGAAMKPAAAKLMNSAVKPAYAMVRNQVRNAELPRVVQTLLKEKVNVTPGGIRKLNDLLDATNAEIDDIIANSRAVVYPEAVAARADDVGRQLANQVAPMDDLAANRKVVEEFMQVHGGAPNLPAKPMSVQQAQAAKVGTYRALGERAYGSVRAAQTETEKALARGLREDIETAVLREGRNIKTPNLRHAALNEAKEAIARRVAAAANRDPGGIGWIAENPRSFLAFVIARSPGAKSMIANGLYDSAARAAKVSPQLIRLAVQALAKSPDEEQAQP